MIPGLSPLSPDFAPDEGVMPRKAQQGGVSALCMPRFYRQHMRVEADLVKGAGPFAVQVIVEQQGFIRLDVEP